MNYEEQAAFDAVMHFLDSYSKRSVEGCMAALALSRPILLLGTNDNEVFRTAEDVRASFTRDFSGMTNIRFGQCRTVHVQAAQELASVLVELPISYVNEGKDVATLIRYALTLAKEEGQWKICAGMASVPFEAGTYSFQQ